MNDYTHHELIELGEDETPYRLITSDFVSTATFEGNEILKVNGEGLTALADQAIRDSAHQLRPGHLAQLRQIFSNKPGDTLGRVLKPVLRHVSARTTHENRVDHRRHRAANVDGRPHLRRARDGR